MISKVIEGYSNPNAFWLNLTFVQILTAQYSHKMQPQALFETKEEKETCLP